MIVHKMKAQKGSDSTMLLDTCKKSNTIGGWGNEELNPVKRVKSNFSFISHCDSKVEILMLSNSLLLSTFAFLFGGKHLKTNVKPTTHTHTHTHRGLLDTVCD